MFLESMSVGPTDLFLVTKSCFFAIFSPISGYFIQWGYCFVLIFFCDISNLSNIIMDLKKERKKEHLMFSFLSSDP